MRLARELYETTRQNVSENGIRGLGTTGADIADFARRSVNGRINQWRSTNAYEREWDLLVLLDCATVQMMQEVADGYDFVGEVGEHFSPGTTSAEWMRNTFTDRYREEMSRTVHVTGNTASEEFLESDQFRHLEEVWLDGWDDELGTIPARAITDRAIYYDRKLSPDRLIVHYMQPHPPFVPRQDVEASEVRRYGISGDGMDVADLHFEAGYDRETLWDAHVENLEYVLDDVSLLLSNVSADRAVLSADHGQAFGEGGAWGHGPGERVDVLRKVPWCVTSASDTGEYEPEYEEGERNVEPDLSTEEKLKSLGYL